MPPSALDSFMWTLVQHYAEDDIQYIPASTVTIVSDNARVRSARRVLEITTKLPSSEEKRFSRWGEASHLLGGCSALPTTSLTRGSSDTILFSRWGDKRFHLNSKQTTGKQPSSLGINPVVPNNHRGCINALPVKPTGKVERSSMSADHLKPQLISSFERRSSDGFFFSNSKWHGNITPRTSSYNPSPSIVASVISKSLSVVEDFDDNQESDEECDLVLGATFNSCLPTVPRRIENNVLFPLHAGLDSPSQSKPGSLLDDDSDDEETEAVYQHLSLKPQAPSHSHFGHSIGRGVNGARTTSIHHQAYSPVVEETVDREEDEGSTLSPPSFFPRGVSDGVINSNWALQQSPLNDGINDFFNRVSPVQAIHISHHG